MVHSHDYHLRSQALPSTSSERVREEGDVLGTGLMAWLYQLTQASIGHY